MKDHKKQIKDSSPLNDVILLGLPWKHVMIRAVIWGSKDNCHGKSPNPRP